MANTAVGSTKLQLPVGKAVGQQYSPPAANLSGPAAAQIAVPPASSLTINGMKTLAINLTTMSSTDVVNAINNSNIAGITASIDGQGRLTISGVNSIDGDANLRAILGI